MSQGWYNEIRKAVQEDKAMGWAPYNWKLLREFEERKAKEKAEKEKKETGTKETVKAKEEKAKGWT